MPIYFKATVNPPFRDILGRFQRANQALLEQQRDSMRVLGQIWLEEVRREAPEGKTGKLRSGHSFKTTQTGGRVELRTYAPQPIATWIIKGTKPHLIVARNAKALAFEWANGPRSTRRNSRMHFYAWVWHPGTKPNDYLGRVHRVWMPFAKEELAKMGRTFTAELVR